MMNAGSFQPQRVEVSTQRLTGGLSAANFCLPLSYQTSGEPFITALLGKRIRTMPSRTRAAAGPHNSFIPS